MELSDNIKRKIFFRADGNFEIGLGHITRCLSLARILDPFFTSHFIVQETSRAAAEEIKRFCSEITFIKNDPGLYEEYKFFPPCSKGDIFVTDGYLFDTTYQTNIRSLGVKLVCIDDIHSFHFVADAVINQADSVTDGQYSAEPYTKLCLGFSYAMLRPPFYNHSRQANNLPGDIFICFGGSDPCNITLKVLNSVAGLNDVTSVQVVIGREFRDKETIEKHPLLNDRVFLRQDIDAETMAAIMKKCQIAICPSSGISVEAMAMHMYILTGKTAENQDAIYSGLLKYPNVSGIGDFAKLEETELRGEFLRFFKNIKENGKTMQADVQFTPGKIIELFRSL